MKNIIIINEVDCYIGNANITHYATGRAVQHQILVNDTPLGWRNGVADSDRGERIVLQKEVTENFVSLFQKSLLILDEMKSERCKTIEEYREASTFNVPIKKRLNNILVEMHNIENLDLDFSTFKRVLLYN